VTGLHGLVIESVQAALPAQRPDGSFAAGCNGPYDDPETPVRNTGHWLVSLCAAHRWTGDERLREAALRATRFLASAKARPGAAAFQHRAAPGKDACNGLVGQAWSIEALAEAAETFDAAHLAELAESVFLLHPQDAATGLWRRVEVDGTPLSCDVTLNHQLWFAAAGALLAPLASPEVATRVLRFLDRLPRNLGLHENGLIRHRIPARVFWRDPRQAARLVRTRAREGPGLAHKEAGYHAFNLYALALLRRHAPDHPFWRHAKFRRLWAHARSGEQRRALVRNEYGYPYNPVGLEMAFALETLEGPCARHEAAACVAEQLRRHWDSGSRGLRRDTPDPTTLAARLYEAVRLPDLPLAQLP
jgi:hypothetical protein